MTEAEWLASADPAAMLRHLGVPPRHSSESQKVSDRKLRLFACGCARRFYPDMLADPMEVDFIPAVERAEAAADLGISPDRSGEWIVSEKKASLAAGLTIDDLAVRLADLGPVPALLRDIVGNPWRPVTLPSGMQPCPQCEGSGCDYKPPDLQGRPCQACRASGQVGGGPCPWLTSAALTLAELAYERRLPDGTLDPVTLAGLADALEEAGCPVEEEAKQACPWCLGRGFVEQECFRGGPERDTGLRYVIEPPKLTREVSCICCSQTGRVTVWIPHPLLAHLRSPGDHYRGMWSLDLVLGKE